MAKVRPFLELLNGTLKVNFHDGQTALWDAQERRVVASCGTQSGKTCFGPVWLDREITRWMETGPSEAGDFLAVSATYKLMTRKMLPQIRLYFSTYTSKAIHRVSDSCFESCEQLRGGPLWTIFLGSADNADSLESATALACWCDEPGQKTFRRESMEALDRRVSIARGRILYTTTPYVWGWFKHEIYDRAMHGEPGYKMVNFKSTMNPAFPAEEYREQKGKLPRWKFSMFYDGVFERPAGQIYDCFDSDTQIIKRFEIPLSWPRYTGHDFGPVHTAVIFYAIEPATGNIFVCRTYCTNAKVSVHENVVLWRSMMHRDSAGKIDEQILKRVGGAKGESGWREAYAAEGWPIAEPKITGPGSVELQIDRVYALNKLNKVFVFDDLLDYIDEKEGYSRELDDNYNPTDKIDNAPAQHYMDAERYILSDFTPETVVREPSIIKVSRTRRRR